MTKTNELTKFMTIGITEDNQCGIRISPNLDAATAYQLVGTLTLHLLNAYYTVATADLGINANSGATSKKHKLTKAELKAASLGIKESMYDAMNSVISSVLNEFYPDAPRTTLEDEAILELTNKKIEERYYSMDPAARAKYKDTYQKIKSNLLSEIKSKDSEDSEDSKDSTISND